MKNLYKKNYMDTIFKSNKVKLLATSLLFILPCQMVYSSTTINHDVKKVEVKCHVLLVDGEEVISFWLGQRNKLNYLEKNIIGKKIQTAKSNVGVRVHEAYECVLEDDAFKSAQARMLDANTPR